MIASRYTLLREIGRGGMGAVWLARDEVLGREVAVKRVGLFPGGTTPDLERAEREAKLAARLNHPHVVAVFDFVADGDEQWLVMEYVDGATLADLSGRRGGLPPEAAAPIIRQAAEALAAAHEAGIVHRDVKPSNILVTADGTAKLTDFGIARARADSTLTRTGMVTGSPAYLAPEVASGGAATEASDVWSLGATLYHALSGTPPYEVGDNVVGALYRIVHEEPPRLRHAGHLAPLLESTMALDPGRRLSMAQVRDFLDGRATGPAGAPAATLEGTPGRTPDGTLVIAPDPTAPPPRRRPPLPALVAVAVVVALVAGLAWLVTRDDGDDTTPRAGNRDTPTSSTPTPSSTPPPAGDADDMVAFTETYLLTATDDPRSAFAMLTPAFQRASGGYDGYSAFWGAKRSATPSDISADEDAMTVSYDVKYKPDKGKPFEDHVVLRLDYDGERYLIADEIR